MRRRDFVKVFGGAAAAWPLAARAQQPTMPVIGLLSTRAATDDPNLVGAIHSGLEETGYIEGKNVTIDARFAANQYDRLQQLAAELVSHQVALIITMGTAAAPAAKAATSQIPVIFAIGDDPIKLGLVASLNKPGGNITGSAVMSEELGPKRLELLHQLVPAAKTAAVILNPTSSSAMQEISKSLDKASRDLSLRLDFLNASNDREIEQAFAMLVQQRLSALLVVNDAFFNSRAQLFASLAMQYRIPGVYPYLVYAEKGGLVSYGASLTGVYREVGIYAGRVLKGEKPAELPVLQPTKFDLVINLKTARALDLNVPPSLLATADQVIE